VSPAIRFGGDPALVLFSRANFMIFFCRRTDRYDGAHAQKKIERASSVNTINQLNPRAKRKGWGVYARLRECGLTKAKKENNFGVSISEFADRANTTRRHRMKTALVATERNKSNYRVINYHSRNHKACASCLEK